jgi:hypothetical protein
MRVKEASQKNTKMKLNERNLILQHIHKTGFTNETLLFYQSEVVCSVRLYLEQINVNFVLVILINIKERPCKCLMVVFVVCYGVFHINCIQFAFCSHS